MSYIIEDHAIFKWFVPIVLTIGGFGFFWVCGFLWVFFLVFCFHFVFLLAQ